MRALFIGGLPLSFSEKNLTSNSFFQTVDFVGYDTYPDFCELDQHDFVVLCPPGKPRSEEDWEVFSDFCRESAASVFLFLSKGGGREGIEALDRGAEDYLVEPFAIEEFLARAHAIMRRTQNRVLNDPERNPMIG